MTTLAYLQWVERKVIAHIQVRPGPYRVGPHGLLQPLADVIKLITKEDLLPPYVNKPLYLLAPFLAITMALLSISRDSLRPGDRGGRLSHLDAAHRPEHRRAVRAGGVVDGGLRHRAGGLGVEQQVRAAGRAAQLGADDQLRAAAVAGHRRAAAAFEHPEPARAGGDAGGRHLALERAARAVPADLQLHHFSDRRRSPRPTACRSICRRRKTSWWPVSTPSTAA